MRIVHPTIGHVTARTQSREATGKGNRGRLTALIPCERHDWLSNGREGESNQKGQSF
jgi:hypothetical protein